MMLVGPIIFVFIPRALSYRPKLITRVQDSNKRKYPFDLSHQISQIINCTSSYGACGTHHFCIYSKGPSPMVHN